jgi:hypothetical protein
MEQQASYDRSTEGSFNAGFGGKAMNDCEKWLAAATAWQGGERCIAAMACTQPHALCNTTDFLFYY